MSCAMILIFFSAATCSLRTVRGTRDESKEEKFEMTLEDGSKGDFTSQEILIYQFMKMLKTPENLTKCFAYLEARVKYLASVLKTPDAYKNDVDWDYENMTALHKERKLADLREIKKHILSFATTEFFEDLEKESDREMFCFFSKVKVTLLSELKRKELQALTTKEELDWAKGEIENIKIMVDALKVCFCIDFLECAYFEKFIENDFEEIKELFEEKDQRFKGTSSGC